MNTSFFTPLPEAFFETLNLGEGSIGLQIQAYREAGAFPDLENVQVAILGVKDSRTTQAQNPNFENWEAIRKAFYHMHRGNWPLQLADLGNIRAGATPQDTYFALRECLAHCLEQNTILLILGGSQDLAYAQYRAYDNQGQMVHYVNVDAKFDLGDTAAPIGPYSYVGKMVVEEPFNLYHYSNIGYQTFYNAQEEINLLEKLYFDTYRLGEVCQQIERVEPVFRNASMASIDVHAIEPAHLAAPNMTANGFNGREICAIARYAGLGDQVSSMGLYHLDDLPNCQAANTLVAQIMWYFIEGVVYRKDENSPSAKKDFIKYQVPVDTDVLTFYKSQLTGRWWLEVPIAKKINNKLENTTLLPCTYEDYESACNQNLPAIWWKARIKNEL